MAAYKPVVKRETDTEKTTTEKEEKFKEVEYNDVKTDNDKEEWKCKACGDDNGDPKHFIGCDTCDCWFHVCCSKKVLMIIFNTRIARKNI